MQRVSIYTNDLIHIVNQDSPFVKVDGILYIVSCFIASYSLIFPICVFFGMMIELVVMWCMHEIISD